ncbi:translation initiation factor IF-2 [Candidatus Peregrinibacteria bacterium]|nr:translation initiation factor IF-2 [Candidatus Peregrinibacteria bacterium]
MSTKIADLAEQLGITLKDLKSKLGELGVKVAPRARVIDDEIATLVKDELKAKKQEVQKEEALIDLEKGPEDIAEIYDEIIAEKQEREIVKSQRKKTAGKDTGKDKKSVYVAPIPVVVAPGGIVEIPDVITVKEFAEKTGIKVAKIIGELMKNGILANINQQIDFDTAQIIADDMGVKLKRKRVAAEASEFMSGDISNLIKEDDPSLLKERPPVVCVMGHVDHGKTKLLDAIRETNVVAGESGGITQHIGAYQAEKKGKLITFLDTPGHEAFTSMRARGAKVTDIAILVVAADEGMKPQTIEALNHAKDANVPIIVALNKMDKPDANPERVKAELAEHDLLPEEWGGKTVVVPVSAVTKQGLDTLLDMILLTAEMMNLKANPDREAVGTVVEAHLDHSLGPIATVLVNTGTLKLMDNIIVGSTFGRIKLMKDPAGKMITAAAPSAPVRIAGLSETPKSGDILQVVKDDSTARERAGQIKLLNKRQSEEQMSSTNQLISQVKAEKILKIIIKADTKGSLEAIKQSIAKIKDEEVAVKVIHSGVGLVSDSDVMMAAASKGMIIAFHADFDSPNVVRTAEREHVEVKRFTIIYDLLENIRKILSGLMEPEVVIVTLGRAQIKQIFLTKKKELILGARVLSGKMEVKARVRIIRGTTATDEDNIVGKGMIDSLRKVDEQVHEVKEGNECGIKFVGDMIVQEGDIFEAYKEEKKERRM